MAIDVTCDGCGHSRRIPEKFSGKRIRCSECSEVIVVGSRSGVPKTRSKRKSRSSDDTPPPPRRRLSPKPPTATSKQKNTAKSGGRSPLLIPAAVGGGLLTLGLVGFLAFKMGQSSDSNPPPAASTQVTDANSGTSTDNSDNEESEPVASGHSANEATSDAETSNPAQPAVAVAPSNFDKGVDPAALTGGSMDTVPEPTPEPVKAEKEEPVATDANLSLPELIAAIEPAVVRIDVRTSQGLGNGSGFIIDDKGTVVTNYHVIAGGQNATAMLSDKSKVRVLGYTHIDPKKDIAILKIDVGGKTLPTLDLIDKPPLKGQGVVAMGAPFGLDSTASEGIVSSMRTADELEHTLGITDHAGTWIQTTTPISPGNSGGPLVNRKGKVVAINTMTLTVGQNLNFGISAMDIRKALENQTSPKSISPVDLPELAQDGKPKVDDIIGTEQAEVFFGRIKKIKVLMLAFAADPRGVVVNSVRDEAIKAIETAGVRLGGNDSEAFLLIGMSLSGSSGAAGAQQLRVTSTIHFQDETSASPRVYKIWESTGRLGTLSLQSLVNGILPRRLSSEVKKHFRELRSEFKRAQAKAKKEPSL